MGAPQTRLAVYSEWLDGAVVYLWVLQTTQPVTDRFRSWGTFATRAEAVADFEATAADMNWKLDLEEGE